MTRGFPPTPTAILQARDSWRGKKRPKEPTPPTEAPSCPSWLKDEAKREWTRQCAALRQMRVISRCDRAALAAYCEAWAEFCLIVQRIAETTLDQAIKKGYLKARNSAVDRLLKTSDRFGFSPAARARVRVAESGKGDAGKGRFFHAG